MNESEKRFNLLYRKARRTNQKRDKMDREIGVAPPGECPPSIEFATAMEALKAGIMIEDWDCVAEGYVMLEHFIKRFHVLTVTPNED